MPNETIIQAEELAEAMDAAPEGARLPSGVVQSVGGGAVLQAVDTSKLTATFVIVTNARNRHGNSLQITATKRGGGLLTDTYQSNPVILFDHGLSGNPFPVAQSSAVRKTTRKATATATFPERLRDIYPGVQNADDLLRNSAAVFAGLSEGLIRMASIGFMPLKAMLRKQDGEEEQLAAGVENLDDWRGLHFTESELQEWSIVTIGADRGALRQTLERGKIHDVKLPQFMRLGLSSALKESAPIEAGPPPLPTNPHASLVAGRWSEASTEYAQTRRATLVERPH